MNKFYDFNAESTQDAKNRMKLAEMLQQIDLMPDQKMQMPETPSSSPSMSPETMWRIKQKMDAKSATPPPPGSSPMVGSFPSGTSMPTYA